MRDTYTNSIIKVHLSTFKVHLNVLKVHLSTFNVYLMKIVVNTLKIKVFIVFLNECKMVIFGINHELEWERKFSYKCNRTNVIKNRSISMCA